MQKELTTEQKREALRDIAAGGSGEIMGVIYELPADQQTDMARYYYLMKSENGEDIVKYVFDTMQHAQALLDLQTGKTKLDV